MTIPVPAAGVVTTPQPTPTTPPNVSQSSLQSTELALAQQRALNAMPASNPNYQGYQQGFQQQITGQQLQAKEAVAGLPAPSEASVQKAMADLQAYPGTSPGALWGYAYNQIVGQAKGGYPDIAAAYGEAAGRMGMLGPGYASSTAAVQAGAGVASTQGIVTAAQAVLPPKTALGQAPQQFFLAPQGFAPAPIAPGYTMVSAPVTYRLGAAESTYPGVPYVASYRVPAPTISPATASLVTQWGKVAEANPIIRAAYTTATPAQREALAEKYAGVIPVAGVEYGKGTALQELNVQRVALGVPELYYKEGQLYIKPPEPSAAEQAKQAALTEAFKYEEAAAGGYKQAYLATAPAYQYLPGVSWWAKPTSAVGATVMEDFAHAGGSLLDLPARVTYVQKYGDYGVLFTPAATVAGAGLAAFAPALGVGSKAAVGLGLLGGGVKAASVPSQVAAAQTPEERYYREVGGYGAALTYAVTPYVASRVQGDVARQAAEVQQAKSASLVNVEVEPGKYTIGREGPVYSLPKTEAAASAEGTRVGGETIFEYAERLSSPLGTATERPAEYQFAQPGETIGDFASRLSTVYREGPAVAAVELTTPQGQVVRTEFGGTARMVTPGGGSETLATIQGQVVGAGGEFYPARITPEASTFQVTTLHPPQFTLPGETIGEYAARVSAPRPGLWETATAANVFKGEEAPTYATARGYFQEFKFEPTSVSIEPAVIREFPVYSRPGETIGEYAIRVAATPSGSLPSGSYAATSELVIPRETTTSVGKEWTFTPGVVTTGYTSEAFTQPPGGVSGTFKPITQPSGVVPSPSGFTPLEPPSGPLSAPFTEGGVTFEHTGGMATMGKIAEAPGAGVVVPRVYPVSIPALEEAAVARTAAATQQFQILPPASIARTAPVEPTPVQAVKAVTITVPRTVPAPVAVAWTVPITTPVVIPKVVPAPKITPAELVKTTPITVPKLVPATTTTTTPATTEAPPSTPITPGPPGPVVPIIPPLGGGSMPGLFLPSQGGVLFTTPRGGRRKTLKPFPVADLFRLNVAQAKLKGLPARSPSVRAARRWVRRSAGLSVPTYEEIIGKVRL